MHNPRDAMEHLAQQMGWLGNLLGEDFWGQIRQATAAAPPGSQGPHVPWPNGAPEPFPPLELYVTPAEVVLIAALPGIAAPEHVTVSLAGPAEAVLEAFVLPDPVLDVAVRRERFSGYCTRTVALPAPVLETGARARYADGILEIRFPRAEPGAGSGGVSLLQVPGPPQR